MAKFQSTVMVSSVGYDPLFGFAGAPTVLVRNLLADRMAEAFAARKGNVPVPGVQDGPLKVATSATAAIPATCIELVADGSGGIAGVHIGSINEAFDKAVSQLQSISAAETDPVKCAILSASGEAGVHSTLAMSLNSLWNSVHAVKEGGSAVLVAENREGVGGGALQMFIEGRLKPEQLHQSPYIDGLEHLLFIEELRQKIELGLVSTLPHYYARTKLGFSTYAGMKDILDKLPEKHGKNFKALVVSDADILLLKPPRA
jgi:nickel-dependent lactate racemase